MEGELTNLSRNRLLLGTWSSLTSGLAIAPYTTTLLLLLFYNLLYSLIRRLGQAGGANPPSHWHSTTEKSGYSVPCHFLIRAVPSEYYRTRLSLEAP